MKEKLLLVSRKWPPAIGGMETYAVELARGLQKIYDLDLLVLKGESDGRAPGLMRYALFILRAGFICLLRARSYDRVIFGDLVLYPVACLHRLLNPKARRLVVLYGLDLVYQKRQGLLSRIYRIYLSGFLLFQNSFTSIIAISSHTNRLAQSIGVRSSVVVNPALPETTPDIDRNQVTFPDSWTALSGAPRILYFGRLVPRKGALWFARNVVPTLCRGAAFFVAGDSTNSMYKSELRNCPRTYCVGRIDSIALARMVEAADVVVMPNVTTSDDALDVEGFGLVAVETSALGGRLVAAGIEGLTDAVVDGVTGTLLPSGDVNAWTAALNSILMTDRRERLPSPAEIASSARDYFSSIKQTSAFMKMLESN